MQGNHNLKNKRKLLKSIKDRLRKQFNIAIAEINYQDKWQRASLAFVTVSSDAAYCDRTLEYCIDFIKHHYPQCEIIEHSKEIMRAGDL